MNIEKFSKNSYTTETITESDNTIKESILWSAKDTLSILNIDEIQWFKLDFIKNLWYEFQIFWSWSEVLNWEKDLKIWDLDIQIIIKNEEDKEIIKKKLEALWFNTTRIKSNHIIASKNWKEYDFHFLEKVFQKDWFIEDGYIEWTLFFPESWYKETWWIKYIKPEITYIMATNSRNLWNNNKGEKTNIEKETTHIDKKTIILMDFVEEITQKKWKDIFTNLTFNEIIKNIEEIINEEDNQSKFNEIKTIIHEITELSKPELENLQKECLKYKKIQKQAKRINRLKDKVNYDEVERLKWLIWFIK